MTTSAGVSCWKSLRCGLLVLLLTSAELAVAQESGPTELITQPLRGVSARNVSLLMSGQNGGEVTGDVVWTVLPGDGERAVVPVVVEVDGEVLMAGARGRWQVVEVVAYVLDQGGAVVGHLACGSRIDRGLHGERLIASGLRFRGRLELPPGVYSFRVLVRNRQTGVYFLSRRDLEVPTSAADELLVLPPLVAGRNLWLDLLGEGAAAIRVPGLEGVPSARPVWAPREPLEMVVGTVASEATSVVAARVVDVVWVGSWQSRSWSQNR